MKYNLNQIFLSCLIFSLFFITGCSPLTKLSGLAVLGGGSIVDQDYQPKKIIISYRAEGIFPKNAEYFLVEKEDGSEAIWEKIPGKMGVLFSEHRETDKGDHFSSFISNRQGYEFIVPKDRSQNAERYVYPWKSYKILRKPGTIVSGAIVPLKNFSPTAILIPKIE